jgi:hypothetical protein
MAAEEETTSTIESQDAGFVNYLQHFLLGVEAAVSAANAMADLNRWSASEIGKMRCNPVIEKIAAQKWAGWIFTIPPTLKLKLSAAS